MKFTVKIAEIHYSYRDVEASSWKEAVEKAQNGDYTHESIEYSHSPDGYPIDVKPSDPDIEGHDTDDYEEESATEQERTRTWDCQHDSYHPDCDSCDELRGN